MRTTTLQAPAKIAFLIVSIGGITLSHFLLPTAPPSLHILHIALRKLYLLPPVMAAAWYGLRGAVLVTLSISVLFSLHAVLDWPGEYLEQANQGGELVSFWVVGLVAGWLVNREQCQLKDLVQAHEETLLGLVSALDMKEHNTNLHSQRVRRYTLLLADRFGLDAVEKKAIGFGALLHDVGKIAVPDRILLKSAPLTGEERRIMNQHPVTGYQIVNRIKFLREAAQIVYCHHERFDGSGYPRGLKGDDIPFGARLFAVVDVYDALTSQRPYRTPVSHDEALAEIKRGSGGLFDPRVVEAFLRLPREEFEPVNATATGNAE